MDLNDLHIGDIIIANGHLGFYNGRNETFNVYFITQNVKNIGRIENFFNITLHDSTPFVFIHSSVTDDVKYQ